MHEQESPQNGIGIGRNKNKEDKYNNMEDG